MTDRKRPTGPPPFPDIPFEEALARLIQTDPKELADSAQEARKKEEEVERYAAEREASIRKGARRAGKRFRL
jgi:hypothetical protein